jgi:putative ABC transport system permease protein
MLYASRIVNRISWRYWDRHPLHFFIIVMMVAAGVASALGIDLAIEASKASFLESLEAISGKATHRIQARPGVPDDLVQKLHQQFPALESSPTLTGRVQLRQANGQRVSAQILGIDPLTDSIFLPSPDSYKNDPGRNEQPDRPSPTSAIALFGERSVAVSAELAKTLGLFPKLQSDREQRKLSSIPLSCVGQADLAVIGYFEGGAGSEQWVVCDLSTAQEVLGRPGKLDSIALRNPPVEALKQFVQAENQKLPAEDQLELVQTGSQSHSSLQLADSLFMNLRALSWLSALIGVFLIYQAYHFSLLVTRPQFTQLRRLGVTPRELLTSMLWESLQIGVLGSALGCILGIALAKGIIGSLTTTLTDLYFSVEVKRFHIDALAVFKALGLGIGCSMAATLPHILSLYRLPPARFGLASHRERLSQAFVQQLLWLGLVGLVGSIWVLARPAHLLVHLVALSVLILSSAALAPGTVRVLNALLFERLKHFGPFWARLGWRQIHEQMNSTAIPLAALSIALSAVVSIETMVFSFRETLNEWLHMTLRSDVYISLSDQQALKQGAAIPESFYQSGIMKTALQNSEADCIRYLKVPAEVATDPDWHSSALLISEGPLSGQLTPSQALVPYRFLSEVPQLRERYCRPLDPEPTVCVSQPFASRHHCQCGDRLVLKFGQRPQTVRVGGIFVDFSTDAGYILANKELYQRLSHDLGYSALALRIDKKPGSPTPESLAKSLRTLPESELLEVRSNADLRELSQTIFERTFSVTKALRWIALIVSMLGMTAALSLLNLQRARDWALLESLGLERNDSRKARLLFGLLLGCWTGLASIPIGLTQAYAMVKVVQLTAFGWSLAFRVPAVILISPFSAALCCWGASYLANRQQERSGTSYEVLRQD